MIAGLDYDRIAQLERELLDTPAPRQDPYGTHLDGRTAQVRVEMEAEWRRIEGWMPPLDQREDLARKEALRRWPELLPQEHASGQGSSPRNAVELHRALTG